MTTNNYGIGERPIEFRAWDLNKKCMIYEYMTGDCNTDGLDVFAGSCFETDEPFPIMQFTNLLDKNGKKIFEGDIVSGDLRDFSFCPDDNQYAQAVIRFSEGGFCATWNGIYEEHETEFNVYRDFSKFTVIGNIFQNPELLS